MTKPKEGIFTGYLKKENGKLVHVNTGESLIYQEFVNLLEEGQQVEVFMDSSRDDATLAQLAKIHKCIREMAKETGNSFEEMKFLVKERAGLCIHRTIEGKEFLDCKSFGKASKSDLALTIETIIEMGDYLGMNLR